MSIIESLGFPTEELGMDPVGIRGRWAVFWEDALYSRLGVV